MIANEITIQEFIGYTRAQRKELQALSFDVFSLVSLVEDQDEDAQVNDLVAPEPQHVGLFRQFINALKECEVLHTLDLRNIDFNRLSPTDAIALGDAVNCCGLLATLTCGEDPEEDMWWTEVEHINPFITALDLPKLSTFVYLGQYYNCGFSANDEDLGPLKQYPGIHILWEFLRKFPKISTLDLTESAGLDLIPVHLETLKNFFKESCTNLTEVKGLELFFKENSLDYFQIQYKLAERILSKTIARCLPESSHAKTGSSLFFLAARAITQYIPQNAKAEEVFLSRFLGGVRGTILECIKNAQMLNPEKVQKFPIESQDIKGKKRKYEELSLGSCKLSGR